VDSAHGQDEEGNDSHRHNRISNERLSLGFPSRFGFNLAVELSFGFPPFVPLLCRGLGDFTGRFVFGSTFASLPPDALLVRGSFPILSVSLSRPPVRRAGRQSVDRAAR
jgi:hypothetical protein